MIGDPEPTHSFLLSFYRPLTLQLFQLPPNAGIRWIAVGFVGRVGLGCRDKSLWAPAAQTRPLLALPLPDCSSADTLNLCTLGEDIGWGGLGDAASGSLGGPCTPRSDPVCRYGFPFPTLT